MTPLKQETYRCKVCGASREIMRKAARLRKLKHVKTMFCPGCGDVNADFIKTNE